MMKTSLLLLIFLPLAVVGQRPKIVFETKSHDFGKVEADNGIVSHAFTFANKGRVPLSIIDVETYCGCTVSRWDDHPVLPGQSGEIMVNLNPANLSGKFNKKITVYSSGNVVTHLKITGEVPTAVIDIEARFPVAVGSLRMSTGTVHLNDGQRSRVIQLFNAGKKNITITSITKPPDIQIDITPVILLPGFRGNLVLLRTPIEGSARATGNILLTTSENLTGIIRVKE